MSNALTADYKTVSHAQFWTWLSIFDDPFQFQMQTFFESQCFFYSRSPFLCLQPGVSLSLSGHLFVSILVKSSLSFSSAHWIWKCTPSSVDCSFSRMNAGELHHVKWVVNLDGSKNSNGIDDSSSLELLLHGLRNGENQRFFLPFSLARSLARLLD